MITKGFNLVVQQDSDSMKTIALVTLAFLPATFVSVSRLGYLSRICL